MDRRRAIAAAVVLGAAALSFPAPAPAAYPGNNGQLVFTSTQDGGARHIFLRGSSGIIDLTGASSSAAEIQPKISPDGREILFTRLAPGLPNSELFVMGADGGQRTQLTNTPQGNSDATWSPNGTQIAFVSDRNSGVPNIFIMRTDGSGVRQITHDTAGKSELAWSPAGDRIAFVRVPAGGGDREIYSIRTNGSDLTDLTRDPSSDDLEPAWSPDGRQIVYSGPLHKGESVGMDLWTMNADGSHKQALHHENNAYSDGAYPAWSPNGRTIVFSANNGSGYYHLWSVPAAGGQNSELVTNKVPGGNPGDEEADWGPKPPSAAPSTHIARGRVGGRTVSFWFQATGPATGYRCQLKRRGHRASFTSCGSPHTYKHLQPGSYTFSVVAFGPNEPYRRPAHRTISVH
jgi:Tol biopolymer transport system component